MDSESVGLELDKISFTDEWDKITNEIQLILNGVG